MEMTSQQIEDELRSVLRLSDSPQKVVPPSSGNGNSSARSHPSPHNNFKSVRHNTMAALPNSKYVVHNPHLNMSSSRGEPVSQPASVNSPQKSAADNVNSSNFDPGKITVVASSSFPQNGKTMASAGTVGNIKHRRRPRKRRSNLPGPSGTDSITNDQHEMSPESTGVVATNRPCASDSATSVSTMESDANSSIASNGEKNQPSVPQNSGESSEVTGCSSGEMIVSDETSLDFMQESEVDVNAASAAPDQAEQYGMDPSESLSVIPDPDVPEAPGQAEHHGMDPSESLSVIPDPDLPDDWEDYFEFGDLPIGFNLLTAMNSVDDGNCVVDAEAQDHPDTGPNSSGPKPLQAKQKPKDNKPVVKPNAPSPLGLKFLKDEEAVNAALENDYIFLLKKKSTKMPSAKYFCRICEYHCTNVAHCERHMNEHRHKRLKTIKCQDEVLRALPAATDAHCAAVTDTLTALYFKIAASDLNYHEREKTFLKFRDLIAQISPTASVLAYGSSVSRLALIDSDLNINIQTDEPARLLVETYDALKADQTGFYRNVMTDFTAKMPVVTATVPYSYGQLTLLITANNLMSVETSKLLQIYVQLDQRVQPLVLAFRHWARMCKIDRQFEGSLPAYVYSLLVIYYLQQCSPPVLPVLHDLVTAAEKQTLVKNGCDADTVYISDPSLIATRWRCSNTKSLGAHWVDLLKFITLLDVSDRVICIRQRHPLYRSEKKWASKKLAVEDPFYRRRNIARSLSHLQMYEYIDERLRAAYIYFGVAPSRRAAVLAGEPSQMEEKNGLPKNGPKVNVEPGGQQDTFTTQDFAFDNAALTTDKSPPIICSICQKLGHLKRACPQDRLPALLPMPNLPKRHLTMLNNFLISVPADFEPRERELRERQLVLSELQTIVRKTYPNAVLCLFGSSCNGFGFHHSDLDITLTFEDRVTDEGLNCVDIIESLAKALKKQRVLYNILPITSAKVPIVKFKHGRTQLEGDISLYNTLAQHNTRMLQTYALIDSRVKSIGYIMKVFAKCADICDASRGSLSSYAYILMVIYYLQQRKPPVIPVLQELHPGQKAPQCIIDRWNAWFYEDLKNLPKAWPGLNKNTESVAELWVGLLKFYTEEFRFDERVVCIRRLQPLSKFEKMWNGFGIAIEDPFNLDHNLGSGVSRKMNVYIQKVLRNGRKMFCTPLAHLPPRYNMIQDYFFDSYLLTDGANPPNDRGCHRCGKIGHFAGECPLLKTPTKEDKNSPGKALRRDQHSQEDSASEDEQRDERDSGGPTRGPSNVAATGRQTPQRQSSVTPCQSATPRQSATSRQSATARQSPTPRQSATSRQSATPRSSSTNWPSSNPTSSASAAMKIPSNLPRYNSPAAGIIPAFRHEEPLLQPTLAGFPSLMAASSPPQVFPVYASAAGFPVNPPGLPTVGLPPHVPVVYQLVPVVPSQFLTQFTAATPPRLATANEMSVVGQSVVAARSPPIVNAGPPLSATRIGLLDDMS